MELSNEDKQRIEQEAAKLFNKWDGGFANVQTILLMMAEYATLYERQQLDKFIVYKDLKTGEMMARYEAERTELLEKMTELLKAFNDSDKNYADWVATKELYSAFTGVNNLLERLNSLKTK